MLGRSHIDVDSAQLRHHGYRCCGDTFVSRRMGQGGRVVSVLSDGLGSGATASVLSTLTASMALGFARGNQPYERTARIIMDTLPVDSRKGVSYATLIIADIAGDGEAQLVEFDNPPVLLFRGEATIPIPRQEVVVETKAGPNRRVRLSKFTMREGDRLVLCSDGVVQSGMGRQTLPFGYGLKNLQQFLQDQLHRVPAISSHALAHAVVDCALSNDVQCPQDDITCGVLYFRSPRRLLVCTGPPYKEDSDREMVDRLRGFKGTKIVCGGTTSQLIAKGLGAQLEVVLGLPTDGLPPTCKIAGVDLVTEGVVTLSRVESILQDLPHGAWWNGVGPAWAIIRHLMESDEIHFLVGTGINLAHYNPELPVELEARRTLVRRIANILEERYSKAVEVNFI